MAAVHSVMSSRGGGGGGGTLSPLYGDGGTTVAAVQTVVFPGQRG